MTSKGIGTPVAPLKQLFTRLLGACDLCSKCDARDVCDVGDMCEAYEHTNMSKNVFKVACMIDCNIGVKCDVCVTYASDASVHNVRLQNLLNNDYLLISCYVRT